MTVPGGLYERMETAVAYIREQGCAETPEVAAIFGSGLSAVSARMEVIRELEYGEIPGFVTTTLGFNRGRLLFGTIGGRSVVAMDGRFHYYEGYDMREITFPVRVMRMLGAHTLMLTNISGALNPQFRSGDIALIVDQINLMGDSPLRGPNDERLGPRFPDMAQPFDRRLITLAEKHAMRLGVRLPRGVYVALHGPAFETPAEYRMLRLMGADMVGMSSVPEVIVAVHSGMRVMGMSLLSDECFPECLEPLDVDLLLERAAEGSRVMGEIIAAVLADDDFPQDSPG